MGKDIQEFADIRREKKELFFRFYFPISNINAESGSASPLNTPTRVYKRVRTLDVRDHLPHQTLTACNTIEDALPLLKSTP